MPYAETEPIETKAIPLERLLRIQSDVEPDGGSAICKVQFTNNPPVPILMRAHETGMLLHELRNAFGTMLRRQKWRLDRGASGLMEMAQNAARPRDVDVIMDPTTADFVLFFHMEDQGPITLRLAPDQLADTRQKVAVAACRAAN